MNLFDYGKEEQLKKSAPLALRMRPRNLTEYVGQEHLMGPGKLLRRAIEADRISSMILHGPPGTGKTALARVIANMTAAEFVQLNAVAAGIGDIRQLIQQAGERLGMWQRHTILFIDEIHRFNKAQQDALLPSVEEGIIVLIGATTENPYFEVNSALLSRSQVFALEPLRDTQIAEILNRAILDREQGLGNFRLSVEEDALAHIIKVSAGDARKALNALELAVLTTTPGSDGVKEITLTIAEESIQQKALLYDKDGDQHYDVVSAFIKSIRGSDPQAALHWLARMLAAGESPRFIARRMMILAAEDIGLADPQALIVATTAAQAFEFIGLPEGRLILAEGVLYLACAPKSNAVMRGMEAAAADLEQGAPGSVPRHLRDNPAAAYLYPHHYPGNYIKQQYLPDNLQGKIYYQPSENGLETEIKKRLTKLASKSD